MQYQFHHGYHRIPSDTLKPLPKPGNFGGGDFLFQNLTQTRTPEETNMAIARKSPSFELEIPSSKGVGFSIVMIGFMGVNA